MRRKSILSLNSGIYEQLSCKTLQLGNVFRMILIIYID